MSTNQYFNQTKRSSEQNLIEDLVIECIKIHGLDVYYIPREFVNKDKIFGEDTISKFIKSKPIEMYLENVNGFEGQGDIISKFGLEVRDSAVFIVSKVRFEKETKKKRPLEGDLIYLPLTKGLFEIKFVEHESPFYQFGKNYVYKVTVELFDYNEETFDTGEKEIDVIDDLFEYKLEFQTISVTGNFSTGDIVYQPNTSSVTGNYNTAKQKATVYSYENGTIKLYNTIGDWKDNINGLTAYITSQDNTKYHRIIPNTLDTSTDKRDSSDNKQIQQESDDVLDFTEDNPFGEP